MPAFGLDISDRTLKFITFKKIKKEKRIEQFKSIDIPEGVIESGVIKQGKVFSDLVRTHCKALGMKYVYIALPEETGYMSMVKLPALKEEEIPIAIESAFPQHVPLPIAESVFDYEVFSSGENTPSSGALLVRLAAFPAKMVYDYYMAVTQAGFMPLGFDTEVQALVRAVVPKNEKDALLIVDFGKTRTTFIIVSQGEVYFTSTIDVSGEDLDRAIAKSLSVSPTQAEEAKKERISLLKSHRNNKMFEIILPMISAIRDEAERYVDFWQTHGAGDEHGSVVRPPIKKILLCGGDSNLVGFPEYLSHTLGISAEYANVWANVASFEDYIPELTLRQSLMYGSAIGLALRAQSI